MGFGVRRETVFSAFRAKKIDCVEIHGSKNLFEVAAPNGEMATECIPPELGRREPQRLADVYDIPIQWFYSPGMIPGNVVKLKRVQRKHAKQRPKPAQGSTTPTVGWNP
jgi:hypothetical protein